MPFVKCPCDDCRNDRLHEIVTTDRKGEGPTTRVRVCSICSTVKPHGLCCPKCGDCRLEAKYTRQRHDGTTVRVKRCCHCGHKIRTQERMVSASA